MVGEEYNATLTAIGSAPISWGLLRGSWLPGGVYLSEDGVISGTPTESGTFEFAVRANNDFGLSDEKMIYITIEDMNP